MRAGLVIALVIACLLAPVLGEDRARFSSGIIHSGPVRIELDIKGAKKLSIANTGKDSDIAWGKLEFTDADGKPTKADLVRSKKKSGKNRGQSYDLSKRGLVKFTAELQVDSAGADGIRILIDHDAPRGEAKPSTASIAALQGNPARGRGVFFGRGTCASCHAVEGRGARVGPDLTQLGTRSKTESIIESITDPDAVLAEGFETNIVEAKDGTPHLGFVVADSKKSITIKDSAAQSHQIDKAEISVRKPQAFSLMPAFGEILSPQQIADLAAFLGTR